MIAWEVYNGRGIVHIDDTEEDLHLPSYAIDPERALLKKEAVSILSNEAKEVIEMIVNSPVETIRALSTPTGLLTKRSIQLGLQNIWHSKFIAKKVIEELSKWVSLL